MLPLYYYNKVEIASVFHIHVCRMWKTHRSLHHHPRRGRACPARALFHNHPLTFHIVGRGLAPPPHIAFIAPYSRQVARPTFPSQPLVPITTHHPNIHLAQKSISKFVKKSEKTVDKSHTPCYNNQAVSRRTRREKRFITACICFLKKKFFKNFQKTP